LFVIETCHPQSPTLATVPPTSFSEASLPKFNGLLPQFDGFIAPLASARRKINF
jgi:hypothetical protein